MELSCRYCRAVGLCLKTLSQAVSTVHCNLTRSKTQRSLRSTVELPPYTTINLSLSESAAWYDLAEGPGPDEDVSRVHLFNKLSYSVRSLNLSLFFPLPPKMYSLF